MADSFHNAGRAAALSSLAAGPTYFAVVLLDGQLDDRPILSSPQTADQIFTWVVFLSVFATIVAFLPILFGTLTMGSIGKWNIGLRHPAMWAMAGAALAGLPFLLADSATQAEVMAGIGAACAIVSRLFVRWRQE